MGAHIEGVGSNLLTIVGVDSLGGTTHRLLPDMIEVGSFIGMAAMNRSEITIKNVAYHELGIIPQQFERLGIAIERRGDDIFIPGGASHGAIDGDFVEIIYHKFRGREGEEKTEGRVVRIIEIGRKTVIGRLSEDVYRHGRRYIRRLFVQPDDPKVMLHPTVNDSMGAEVGDKVEALIRRDGTSSPECDVVRVFGHGETREANYAAILSECGIVTDFTDEELSLAEQLSSERVELGNRLDLRGDTVFTIDGAGAKDLDDAVSLRRLPGGGFRLGVHIADVSHYVRERTALDRCAMQRGTSVYFTDKVVPMLPPALSNGACSLNAGEDKYTLSALIDLDKDANIKSVRLAESVICSKVRGVYSEVNAILDGSTDRELKKKYASVIPTLLKMQELYEILLKKSKNRGAIDFDADEAVIILNSDGSVAAIEKRERGISERIIEQFMLTANEAVADYLTKKNLPCVYRIHEEPPAEGFAAFLDYLESLGFNVNRLRRSQPTPFMLSEILREAQERGLEEAVSYTMLRAMAKAKYSEQHKPHFGLGIEYYCHFTSPIRRLSDLATHRIIKKVLLEGKRVEGYTSYARRAAAAATEGELRAINAERRIEDLYKVIYMSDRIGDVYPAKICSITGFGIFCTLENTCEGLIPISTLPGVFTFDERNLTMRKGNKIYRIADEILITVEEANLSRGKLRFAIYEEKDN
jgi:ribonuclease R